jgi:hypothetical protein
MVGVSIGPEELVDLASPAISIGRVPMAGVSIIALELAQELVPESIGLAMVGLAIVRARTAAGFGPG